MTARRHIFARLGFCLVIQGGVQVILNPTGSGASATIYYVDDAIGNDSNTCAQAQSESTPKKTIPGGIACISGGGVTLEIKGGTYTARPSPTSFPTAGGPSSRVVIRAAAGETVLYQPVSSGGHAWHVSGAARSYIDVVGPGFIIDGANNGDWDLVKHDDAHHWRYINVEFRNSQRNGVLLASSNSSNETLACCNEFLNVNVHHTSQAIVSSAWPHAFYIGTADNIVDGSEIHENGGYAIHNYNSVKSANRNRYSNNNVWGNGTRAVDGNNVNSGFVLSSGDDLIAYNNIIRDGIRGPGIQNQYFGTQRTKILNNTIYNMQGPGSDCIYTDGVDGTIQNNICRQNGNNAIVNAGSGQTISNNITGATDPLFVNEAGDDFHVQEGSAAIDGGVTKSEVAVDLDGVSRPQRTAYDLGAYEKP